MVHPDSCGPAATAGISQPLFGFGPQTSTQPHTRPQASRSGQRSQSTPQLLCMLCMIQRKDNIQLTGQRRGLDETAIVILLRDIEIHACNCMLTIYTCVCSTCIIRYINIQTQTYIIHIIQCARPSIHPSMHACTCMQKRRNMWKCKDICRHMYIMASVVSHVYNAMM